MKYYTCIALLVFTTSAAYSQKVPLSDIAGSYASYDGRRTPGGGKHDPGWILRRANSDQWLYFQVNLIVDARGKISGSAKGIKGAAGTNFRIRGKVTKRTFFFDKGQPARLFRFQLVGGQAGKSKFAGSVFKGASKSFGAPHKWMVVSNARGGKTWTVVGDQSFSDMYTK